MTDVCDLPAAVQAALDLFPGAIVTGARRLPADPAPRESGVPVTFEECLIEMENEAARHEAWRDKLRADLAAMAETGVNSRERTELRNAIVQRGRLVELYGLVARILTTCRDDQVIRQRMRAIAAEKAAAASDADDVEGDE